METVIESDEPQILAAGIKQGLDIQKKRHGFPMLKQELNGKPLSTRKEHLQNAIANSININS